MKALLTVILLVLLAACNSNSIRENSDSNDSLVPGQIDSLPIPIENEMLIPEERMRLEALLSNPINLERYKADYGTSNSGHTIKKEFFLQPDTIGFYYRYMLFNGLKKVLKSHPSESKLFTDFQIITYKYGQEVGNFYDNNEVLIAIECAMKNETLGHLDLFGMTKDEVQEQYGSPDRMEEKQGVYFSHGAVLSIHYAHSVEFSDDSLRVDWFKFIRVNNRFDIRQKLPSYLYNYE